MDSFQEAGNLLKLQGGVSAKDMILVSIQDGSHLALVFSTVHNDRDPSLVCWKNYNGHVIPECLDVVVLLIG